METIKKKKWRLDLLYCIVILLWLQDKIEHIVQYKYIYINHIFFRQQVYTTFLFVVNVM